ncbi:MAG: carboxypeptidase-like regulatory domain-containing protein [Cyclobacteriaceae bacterium]
MRKLLFISALVLIASFAQAQTVGSISGKVIDSKTKGGIPGASVYLAHTTIGVSANADGTFTLDKIPNGKYDLTVSMIGYKIFSRPIAFDGNSIVDFTIQLEENTVLLDSVVIKARRIKDSNRGYIQFQKMFLGETKNSYQCSILNRKDITVFFEGRKLHAYASKPIIIENKALGYKISYELSEFEVDYELNTQIISGIARFEELTPESAKQKNKWAKERDRAYYGSINHFFQTLKKRTLSQSHYILQNENGVFISEKEIINNDIVKYKGKINILYTSEIPEFVRAGRPQSGQSSDITFSGKPIKVYDNGYYEDFHDISIDGYLVWISKMADVVPYDYSPSKQLK